MKNRMLGETIILGRNIKTIGELKKILTLLDDSTPICLTDRDNQLNSGLLLSLETSACYATKEGKIETSDALSITLEE